MQLRYSEYKEDTNTKNNNKQTESRRNDIKLTQTKSIPIANPTSASFNCGASFVPSPVTTGETIAHKATTQSNVKRGQDSKTQEQQKRDDK
jgi:hypothetical protein